MTHTYRTKGVCAMQIQFDLENGRVSNVKFMGGCNGNTQGVAKLAEGRDAKELIEALEGIKCGFRNTSCPDQLAQAIKAVL